MATTMNAWKCNQCGHGYNGPQRPCPECSKVSNHSGSYTPGPWAWQLFGDTYTLTAQHGRREQIVSAIPHGAMKYPVVAMNKGGRLVDVDPEFPNAKLIAAAPELLEALLNLVREIRAYSSPECDDDGSIGSMELKAADAAIAKATATM